MQETIQPLLLTVPQVAKSLNLGRTKVYELIASKQLPVVRFGRAVRVSSASLRRWVEQQEWHDKTA
jgi:excisionase family DNA binding protein